MNCTFCTSRFYSFFARIYYEHKLSFCVSFFDFSFFSVASIYFVVCTRGGKWKKKVLLILKLFAVCFSRELHTNIRMICHTKYVNERRICCEPTSSQWTPLFSSLAVVFIFQLCNEDDTKWQDLHDDDWLRRWKNNTQHTQDSSYDFAHFDVSIASVICVIGSKGVMRVNSKHHSFFFIESTLMRLLFCQYQFALLISPLLIHSTQNTRMEKKMIYEKKSPFISHSNFIRPTSSFYPNAFKVLQNFF